MTTYEFYLFGHLLGVFLLVGAAGLSTAAGISVGRASSANVVVTLLDLQRFSEYVVTSAGTIVAVVFGMLLVDEGGFEFGDPWVSAAMTLVVVVLAIDHGVLMRRNRRARAAAAALGNGPVSSDLKAMLNDPVTVAAGALLDISFLVFLWLMVVKPGG
jgi:uncharacterized membrane protein